MPLANAKPLTIRLRSLSDAVDGTNAFPGAMTSLSNLIPAPHTADQWICRPAATTLTSFGTFTTPAQIELLFQLNARIYGIIASGKNAGKSEPFIFDLTAVAFVAVTGVTSGNSPTSQPTIGEWIPCTATAAGSRVMVTHPGFQLPNAFGWFDMTGFSSASLTGNTHTSTSVTNLSADALAAGWRPGMTISDSAGDLPAGCRIVSIAAGGLSLTLSAAATGTNAATTFTVAGGTFAAPLWCAGNLNENGLVAVATAVEEFAASACYAVNTNSPPSAGVVFADPADPLRCTNAAGFQIITFTDSHAVTALVGLPQSNVTGGIIQSLLVFQGDSGIQSLTGTPATNTLAVNALNDSVGTQAPLSIVATPLGLMFIAPDGLRVISFAGAVSDVIGEAGQGIATPFIYARNPSRICAAYNEDVYRVSVTAPSLNTVLASNTVTTREYWFHLGLKKWSGPHSFPAGTIVASQTPHGFVMSGSGINGKLWSSDALPNASATYTENGLNLFFNATPVLLPDTGAMAENEVVEAAIAVTITSMQPLTISFINEAGKVLDTVTVTGPPVGSGTWGSGTWGSMFWGAAVGPFQQYQMQWHTPLVFHQGTLSVSGPCSSGLILGNFYLRYQILRYLLQGIRNYA